MQSLGLKEILVSSNSQGLNPVSERHAKQREDTFSRYSEVSDLKIDRFLKGDHYLSKNLNCRRLKTVVLSLRS